MEDVIEFKILKSFVVLDECEQPSEDVINELELALKNAEIIDGFKTCFNNQVKAALVVNELAKLIDKADRNEFAASRARVALEAIAFTHKYVFDVYPFRDFIIV